MPGESDDLLADILDLNRIAVVGCSTTPGKAAHEVPRYLLEKGYDVIPVNPTATEVFGRKAYDSLTDIEEDVDTVNVFRPSEEVADIVDEAIMRPDIVAIWTQLGIQDDNAAARARSAGIDVVQDHCIKVEHVRLLRP